MYMLVIKGDGSVTYNGEAYVVVKGSQTATIDQGHIQKLVEAFQAADYFSLQDNYRPEVTDMPTVITSIRLNGQFKQVSNYGDCVFVSAAPQKLCDLEGKIDEIAGTSAWVGRVTPGLQQ